jgi:flavodoxin
MKKTIVIYYSNNGSNRFLAHKIADRLQCDIEEIRPRLNIHLFLLFGLSLGNRNIKSDLVNYERIILCGPIWMGKFISPLKDFVIRYNEKIRELVFVTCCASSFKMKYEKFGHGYVFKKVREIAVNCVHCEAMPITLVVPEDKREDAQVVMNTRLNEANFNGEILQIFDGFIKKMSA